MGIEKTGGEPYLKNVRFTINSVFLLPQYRGEKNTALLHKGCICQVAESEYAPVCNNCVFWCYVLVV